MLITESQPLNQFLTFWLENTAQVNLSARTYIRYKELITRHVLPTLGKTQLHKLTPLQLQKLYREKLQEGLAPGTVKNIHMLLHKAFNDARKWGLVARNVCEAVDAPRVPEPEMQALTVEQARHLLEAAQGDPLEALYILARTTGMREGELLGLKWEDVNLMNGKLQIQRTITRVPHQGFVVSEPKTRRSRRLIHLTPLTIEALKRHQLRQHEVRLAARSAWDEQGWIFCNSVGKPLEAASLIMRSFRPLLKKAELPQIRFHDLRHTVASFLLALGVHPKVVQELLGHSQISLTLDTYSHVLPLLQEEALNRLDALLSQSS